MPAIKHKLPRERHTRTPNGQVCAVHVAFFMGHFRTKKLKKERPFYSKCYLFIVILDSQKFIFGKQRGVDSYERECSKFWNVLGNFFSNFWTPLGKTSLQRGTMVSHTHPPNFMEKAIFIQKISNKSQHVCVLNDLFLIKNYYNVVLDIFYIDVI